MGQVIRLSAWKRKRDKRELEKRVFAARLKRLGLTVAEENRRLAAWRPSRS